MSVSKILGFKTQLGFGSSAGASTTTFTKVAGLISLPGPDGSGDDVDTSTIDNTTNFKTFERAQVDPGEMALVLAYGSTDASQKQLGTLYASGEVVSWGFIFGSTAASSTQWDTNTFDGYVKSMGRAIEKDAMITRPIGIKVSGDPGFPTT